ncbi:hypothetical protein PJL15_00182 [Paenarthrobacter nitroguajacolicus]|nr:hypothetical protein [Paenarthrobacter nitroguajacolicus]
MWTTVRLELSHPHENDEDAAKFLLKYWAREIVEGRIDVLPGSRFMYRVGGFPLGQPTELNELVYLLGVWDEMPLRRERTSSELLGFARTLLAC